MLHDDRHIRQEIRLLKKLAKQNPSLFARLGDCHLRLGDADRAETILKEGLSKLKDYPNAYRVLAEIQFWKGFYRDAEENCRKGLQLDPNHLGLLHLLMRIKKKEDDDKEAGKLQRTLAQLDPLYIPEYVLEADAFEEEVKSEIPTPSEIWKINASRRETKKEEASPATVESVLAVTAAMSASDLVETKPAPIVAETKSAPVVVTAAPPPMDTPASYDQAEPEPLRSLKSPPKEIPEKPSKEVDAAETDAVFGIDEKPEGPLDQEESEASGGIATRTLAELYAKQGKYDEAIEVYRDLLDEDPLNDSYQARLQELVQLLEVDLENRKTN